MIPVITEIAAATHARISVDTVKSSVAKAALDAGASIINDVSGMRLDPQMAPLAATAGCDVVLMHSRGSVAEMASYDLAAYGEDPVGEILAELKERVTAARKAGIARERIIIDPGIGFSKTSTHSLAVLREIRRFTETGYAVLLGASRKRVVSEIAARQDPADPEPKLVPNAERDRTTAALNVAAYRAGVNAFRVHDVKGNRAALDAEWRRRIQE